MLGKAITLLVAVMVLGALPALGQEDEALSPGQQKHVSAIAAQYDVSEAEVAELRDSGAGWGVIRHAFALAAQEGISGADALARIQGDEVDGKPPWAGGPKHTVPPGQAKKFTAFPDLGVDQLAELRSSGHGWGLIRRAARIAAMDGISITEALEQLTSTED